VFPETTLWFDGHLLLGATRPLVADQATFERKVRDPRLREALAGIGIPDFAALRALYRGGPRELAEYVGAGPLLTDDRPAVEYFLSVRADDSEP
jgi:spermidine synthase